jgi:hypothetical protein
MRNRIKIAGSAVLLLIAVMAGVMGCVSYSYSQAVMNETGSTVAEVYIRDTGATDWGSVKNVQARTDSEGYVIYRDDGRVAYWDKYSINNGKQLYSFRDSGSSETPKEEKNKDILIRDSNGVLYMKQNVSITYGVTKVELFFGSGEELVSTTPIIFTVEDRLPMLFVENRTGYGLTVIAPVEVSISNGQRTQFQPTEINRNIDVTYRIAQAIYTEQVAMGSADTTVTLTKRPPTITIVNNVGSTVNMIRVRKSGTLSWEGGNITISNDQLVIRPSGSAVQTGDQTGILNNRERIPLWLGNVPIEGNTFDIMLADSLNNSYVKSNLQITSDTTLTFTPSDKP